MMYKAIGFPVNMFTVLFAIGRLPGWTAHWQEMMQEPSVKIGRPRQLYTGPSFTDYVPMDRRNDETAHAGKARMKDEAHLHPL